MIRLFWNRAVAAAILSVSLAALPAGVQAGPFGSPSKKGDAGKAEPAGETIVLQEQGKPDRKCVIVSSTPRPDGSISHKVKALDNGEIMTIVEPKNAPSKTVTTGEPTAKPTAPSKPEAAPVKGEPAKKAEGAKSPYNAATPAAKPNQTAESKASDQKLYDLATLTPLPPKYDSIPSAANPPKSSESKKVAEPVKTTKLAPADLPRGARMPAPEAPRGTASVSEPAPLAVVSIPQEIPAAPVINAPSPVPVNPAMTVSRTATPGVGQMKEMLQEALQPSHREMAAEGLCALPQATSHEVRSLLVQSVQKDPAATVRVTCLRCLAKQNVNDGLMQAALESAMKDQDSRVRSEAKSIVSKMK